MSAIVRPQNSDILNPVLNRMKSTNASKLCMSRWGMPDELAGPSHVVTLLRDRGLKPVGNALDFRHLDTTSFGESHQEDFCCIQIPVELWRAQSNIEKPGGRETSSAR